MSDIVDYLLNNEERPECILFNCSLNHILIGCVDVADIRQTFYNVNTISDLFINVAGIFLLKILNFKKKLIYIQKYN